uniref:Cystatin domain-containing protein n=1 Tax=Florenciella parvula TaxID=236787 RepID=A0A7S2G949_9STRA|mmetsp:Transcript_86912/g.246274  ORF Transcript_86912/g.246274 Transcript_86912/m.246274 type:complete len:121 (-) Transcript_86912:133-495(-)|eukprot:CAMPEP_0119483320 /NCGR_PEP_ID=MMETSP1344-20130328/10770_1 /TAXON_ID=236787 /ORGANISM="Florenciella parvula, Strain CCMP2471" /LENGTH=120 /DNA_ID=CAMNT_0007517805 /DNA_START=820 /DNA_END=1182 /DNA_ORIENTATION=-
MKVVALLSLLLAPAAAALGGMAGGLSNIDINDSRVQEAAELAVDRYDSEGGRLAARKCLGGKCFKVVSAQKQVVSGVKYVLDVQIQEPGGECELVHAEIIDQSWTKTFKVLDMTSGPCSA